MPSIIGTISINLYPILLFAIPLIILKIRNSSFTPIYARLYYGLVIFFLVYWVLPNIYQDSSNIANGNGEDINFGNSLVFLNLRSFSLLTLYLQYFFILLPFIFIISPILSVIILFIRLRKESSEKMQEKLRFLTYDFDESPKQMILSSIKRKDWDREIAIFKGFIILLPISLYLLTVILDIAQLEPVNIAESESALGWFIEILFVYIATLLFGFQLIKASKVSFQGRSIGEQIQENFFGSLTKVGTPIAVLSTLLFIAQKTESILLILYFFAYFMMASYIFIISLRIFEPFSIFIFLKIIEISKKFKNPMDKIKSFNNIIAIIYSIIATAIVIGIVIIFDFSAQFFINLTSEGINYEQLALVSSDPSFSMIKLIEGLSILNSLRHILLILILAYGAKKVLERNLANKISLPIFVICLIIFTIIIATTSAFTTIPIPMNQIEYWINGTPIELDIFGISIFSMRTAFFTADFGNNWVLLVLAAPFRYIRSIAALTLWGYIFTYFNRAFRKYRAENPENVQIIRRYTLVHLKETVYLNNIVQKNDLLITIKKSPKVPDQRLEDQHIQILKNISNAEGIFLQDLFSKVNQPNSKTLELLVDLTNLKLIQWWLPELSYQYEQAILDGLYLLYEDGRNLLFHNFRKDKQEFVNPELVAGMFSAITAFIQETTHTTTKVASIDSGDRKVLLEYSESFPIFVALFADRENIAVREPLKNLLAEFGERHKKILNNWSGDTSLFYEDKDLITKYFQDFL